MGSNILPGMKKKAILIGGQGFLFYKIQTGGVHARIRYHYQDSTVVLFMPYYGLLGNISFTSWLASGWHGWHGSSPQELQQERSL